MNDFYDYNDSYAVDTPKTRSLFVTLLGGFYAVTCGIGAFFGVFTLFSTLLQVGSLGSAEFVAALVIGLLNLALNTGLCYTGVGLIQRKSWARKVTLVLNYLSLAFVALGLLFIVGMVVSSPAGFGHAFLTTVAAIFVVVYIAMGAFYGYTIKRLISFDVINEFTAIEDAYQDDSYVQDVFS